jgi:hypothetical protein
MRRNLEVKNNKVSILYSLKFKRSFEVKNSCILVKMPYIFIRFEYGGLAQLVRASES